MNYEDFLIKQDKELPEIIEFSFKSEAKGFCIGNNIVINKNITDLEKKCVLAEEYGHFFTTTGNILDQSKAENRKQELKARAYAYDMLMGLEGLVRAYINGCRTSAECAEFLDVTENFLKEGLEYYKTKYADGAVLNGYKIRFFPYFHILE